MKMKTIMAVHIMAGIVAIGGVWRPAAAQGPVPANVSVCFTPGPSSCAETIASVIDNAQASIRVQAYYLTSLPILKALAAARRRGVDVAAILDKSQDRQEEAGSRYSGATYLAHAGVPVWIDESAGIAHNKVIVIDGTIVITGSFNFTKAADTRNAENVVVLQSPEIAALYAANWDARRSAARSFEIR